MVFITFTLVASSANLDFYVNAFKIIVSNILCDTFLLLFYFLVKRYELHLYFKQAKQSLVNI